MAYPYVSETGSGYSDQNYWQTGTPMLRNASHGSDYSAYSGSSSGQFNDSLSPSSIIIGGHDYATPEGAYTTDRQSYDTGYQPQEPAFDFQLYNFITNGDSGQGPYWQLKQGYSPSIGYPAIIPVEPSPEL